MSETLTASFNSLESTLNEPKQKRKIRRLVIQEIDRGYIIEAGCQSLAIESKDQLIKLFTMYLNNPGETEEKYNSGILFNPVTQ